MRDVESHLFGLSRLTRGASAGLVRPVLGFLRIRTSQVLALCCAGPLSVSCAPYLSITLHGDSRISIESGASPLTITDPIEAVESVVRKLRPQVDVLCVLSHCGALDEEIARRCDVDCVFGGHVHDERISTVGETICIRPNANGHRIGDVDLDTGAARFHETEGGPIDERVRNVFETMRDDAGLDEVVGVVRKPISRSRERRLGGECRAGNFVADAYRWAAAADCALHNSGGMRDGPPLVGEIEIADLVSLVPFDEQVVVAEVSGRELRAILSEAYRAPHGEAGWYAHLSGVRVVYDTSSATLVECAVGGEPLDPERTYSLATNAYLLSARHEFSTLTPTHRVRELDTQYEELAAYAREHGISPRTDGRIVLRDDEVSAVDSRDDRS